ncbi:hypothetical protein R3I93_010525 [Phoxinus phoxinus]|uniref:Uncharacterized protein n=1 Tax=Phoxinus phoxinus TaxID=58324 RepID=A0AAN9D0B8_9TELE
MNDGKSITISFKVYGVSAAQFLSAPVGGVVHQAGACNVAWAARGGSGQADWSPWALACSAAFGSGPLKNHLLRGHTHRSLCGGRVCVPEPAHSETARLSQGKSKHSALFSSPDCVAFARCKRV